MLVKSWEEYLKKRGIEESSILPDVSMVPEKFRAVFINDLKLQILIDEVNGGKEADWENDNEEKYVLWWWMDGVSGAGFRLDFVYFSYSYSVVGSRFTFRNRKAAEHAAKHFFEMFKIHMYGK